MAEGIPISVDPSAINEYVAKQIIDSALGERLHETVEDALKQLGRYGNDPLKTAVQSEINKCILELVRTEFSSQIEEAVREALTPEFINQLVTAFVSSITAQINKHYFTKQWSKEFLF